MIKRTYHLRFEGLNYTVKLKSNSWGEVSQEDNFKSSWSLSIAETTLVPVWSWIGNATKEEEETSKLVLQKVIEENSQEVCKIIEKHIETLIQNENIILSQCQARLIMLEQDLYKISNGSS